MSILDNKKQGKRKSTKGFSELNRRTYEASPAGKSNKNNTRDNQNNYSPNLQSAQLHYQNNNMNVPQNSSNSRNYRNNNQNNFSAPQHMQDGTQKTYQNQTKNYSYNANAFSNNNQNPYNPNVSTADYSRESIGNKYSKKLKKNRLSKKAKIILIILFALFIVIFGSLLAFGAMINSNLNEGMENINLTPTSLNEPFYMVLMGVDSSDERKADGTSDADYRSDSIILARIDPKDNKVSLMSLHRDVEVDMGQYGTQKLNAAHSLGGPQLVIDCVSKLAGVNINHYAEINFDGFKSAVDNLGGIEVDVPMDIADPYAGVVNKGLQTLNGEDALTVCRSRHAYDDYGDGDKFRAANQRLVLAAIAKKLLKSDVATIAKTITDLSQYIKTDLELNDIIGLAQRMKDIDVTKDVYSAMMPTEGVYKNGAWYEELDEDKWKEMMKRMDQGLPPSTETVIDDNTGVVLSYSGDSQGNSTDSNTSHSGSVAVRNGTEKEGIAASAASKIESMGFKTDVGNANSTDFSKTVIVYNDDSKKSDAEAIKAKLGCGSVIKNDNEYSFSTDILVVLGTDYSS